MASLEENKVDAAIGRGEDAEEEEEEQLLFSYVPYIHNGYILDHLSNHGNTATARMLFDLPLCRLDKQGLALLASSVSRLKNKRDTLAKKRSKSTEGENEFQQFLNSEFVFPVSSQVQRS